MVGTRTSPPRTMVYRSTGTVGMQVIAFSLKAGVGQDVHPVEVACGPPVAPPPPSPLIRTRVPVLAPAGILTSRRLPILLQDPAGAVIGFLQADLDWLLKVLARVGAGPGTESRCRPRSPIRSAKDLAEKVRERTAAAKEVLQVLRCAIATYASPGRPAGPLPQSKSPACRLSVCQRCQSAPSWSYFSAFPGQTGPRGPR